jgi:trans-aconitate 2-methyltransferase
MDSTSHRAAWYQDFAREVGERDWTIPNPRHEQLKLFADEILRGRKGLEILDVGCGAGVLSAHLARYGRVLGIDLSEPAIELARRRAPAVEFRAGSPAELPATRTFDLITLWDVLEHVPAGERQGFLSDLRGRLREPGLLVLTTPHPGYTRWLLQQRPDLLQVVDEPVEPAEVVGLAAALGLELARYETYDVDRGHPQYQLLVVHTPSDADGNPEPGRALRMRMLLRANPLARWARRARRRG